MDPHNTPEMRVHPLSPSSFFLNSCTPHHPLSRGLIIMRITSRARVSAKHPQGCDAVRGRILHGARRFRLGKAFVKRFLLPRIPRDLVPLLKAKSIVPAVLLAAPEIPVGRECGSDATPRTIPPGLPAAEETSCSHGPSDSARARWCTVTFRSAKAAIHWGTSA